MEVVYGTFILIGFVSALVGFVVCLYWLLIDPWRDLHDRRDGIGG